MRIQGVLLSLHTLAIAGSASAQDAGGALPACAQRHFRRLPGAKTTCLFVLLFPDCRWLDDSL